MNCCENPKPRISEVTGRMFCASCRRYVDVNPTPQEPPQAPEPEETDDPSPEDEGDAQ